MKYGFIYIIGFLLLSLISVLCLTTKGSIAAMILGVIFALFAILLLINFVMTRQVLKHYENIIVKNGIFIISPIDSVDQIELYADDITSIDFFVLPILNDGNKYSSNYNKQVRINTIDDKFIVYCSNKDEFKKYIEANFEEKIA